MSRIFYAWRRLIRRRDQEQSQEEGESDLAVASQCLVRVRLADAEASAESPVIQSPVIQSPAIQPIDVASAGGSSQPQAPSLSGAVVSEPATFTLETPSGYRFCFSSVLLTGDSFSASSLTEIFRSVEAASLHEFVTEGCDD